MYSFVHRRATHDIHTCTQAYIIMPQWAEPRRHTVVVLCVCVCMSLLPVSLQRLKGKR